MALLLLVNECGVSLNNRHVQPMSLKRSSMSFSILVVRLSSECFLQSISFQADQDTLGHNFACAGCDGESVAASSAVRLPRLLSSRYFLPT
jgi:hypothetical protein